MAAPRKPRPCGKCGVPCESNTAALAHCPRRSRRPPLTSAEDAEILQAYAAGENRKSLAAKWGITQDTVGIVLKRAHEKLELLIGPTLEPPRPVRHVHFPRTGGRRVLGYCKILTGVRADLAGGGFAFEGRFVPPGSRMPEDKVFLEGMDPEFAIVIEDAGPDRSGGLQHRSDGGGHKRFPTLHLLWRIEHESLAWRELARTSSTGAEWVLDLGPIAARALAPAAALAGVELLPRLEAAADRIVAFVRQELAGFEASDHAWLLGLLHDPLASIFVSALGNPMRRPPARSLEARIVSDDEEEVG